jgi:hypothetical protein
VALVLHNRWLILAVILSEGFGYWFMISVKQKFKYLMSIYCYCTHYTCLKLSKIQVCKLRYNGEVGVFTWQRTHQKTVTVKNTSTLTVEGGDLHTARPERTSGRELTNRIQNMTEDRIVMLLYLQFTFCNNNSLSRYVYHGNFCEMLYWNVTFCITNGFIHLYLRTIPCSTLKPCNCGSIPFLLLKHH